MKNLKTIFTFILLASLFLIACKKEKQDAATTEETSSVNYGNGTVENFQKMPNGTTVVFSNWITKTNANWTGFGTTEITTNINAPSLTDAVKNNGLVLVYYDHFGAVRQLPVVRLEFGQVTDYSFSTQNINLSIRLTGGGVIVSGVADLNFRYVLIPSSAFGNGPSGRMSKSVDYSDYNAVCKYYGISK
jgi:hypothetical protein